MRGDGCKPLHFSVIDGTAEGCSGSDPGLSQWHFFPSHDMKIVLECDQMSPGAEAKLLHAESHWIK